MIGLLLLKHIFALSDEEVCERWVYDPYFQHFTGEEFFQHEFPHERSGLSHWRKRLGDKLGLLLAESLRAFDEHDIPAYLESTNPANDHRYERAGFRPLGGFRSVIDGAAVTTMWRDVPPVDSADRS